MSELYLVNGEYAYRKHYIWQSPDWPAFTYDAPTLEAALAHIAREQGRLQGRLAGLGFSDAERAHALLAALSQDALKTSEIEGENLNLASVRSAIARKLGVDIGALLPTELQPISRRDEGVVEMTLDAVMQPQRELSLGRLFSWHAALFPVSLSNFSGLPRITVGALRDDATEPMQVVSGAIGRQTVHFEAPPAAGLANEMKQFLAWFNTTDNTPLLLKAGLAHLWCVTIHPFDDGNGRIARAVGDLLLARAEGTDARYYSLSAQIQLERQNYYDQLERAQGGGLNMTGWLTWWLGCLGRAVAAAHVTVDGILAKSRYWQALQGKALNGRQMKVLNRLLDSYNTFEGKLNTSKYAALAKCSNDTALRDLSELVALGALYKSAAGGRSTSYELHF